MTLGPLPPSCDPPPLPVRKLGGEQCSVQRSRDSTENRGRGMHKEECVHCGNSRGHKDHRLDPQESSALWYSRYLAPTGMPMR